MQKGRQVLDMRGITVYLGSVARTQRGADIVTQWHHYGTADGGWIDPPPGMTYRPESPKPNTGVVPARIVDLIHLPVEDRYFFGRYDATTMGGYPVDPTHIPAHTRIGVAFGHAEVLPSLDFETYSEAGYVIEPSGRVRGVGSQGKGGLPAVGTPIYAAHPSTRVLSLVYDLKDGKGRRHWAPGFPLPLDLIEHVLRGGLLEAWNITFEWYIWNMVCTRVYGWPALPLEQCRCAMAKARRYSLCGALDNTAKVLGTPRKDPDGKRLLEKLSRPLTPTKNRQAIRWTEATAWDDFVKLYRYNDGDVVAEDHASARIPELSPRELEIWQLDQTINARGVQVDVVTLDAALDVLGQAERKYTRELAEITEGHVGSVSEVAKFGEWLRAKGCGLVDLTKDTVADTLTRTDLPPVCRRALEIRETLGAANVKKLRTLKLQVSSDGRLRDQYTYCGADQTKRWAAGGVQLQNITAKGPKTCRCEGCSRVFGQDVRAIGCPRCGSWMFHDLNEWDIEAVEQAIEDIRTASLEWVERVWGDPVAVLCGILRGLFIAREGYELVCCDFSAIEAVVAACLSRCQWRIDVFNTHGKIYEMSVSKVTGIPLEEILAYKKQHGKHHPLRGTLGKIRELAGPYGGWVGAWKNFGADDYFPDDEAIKADVLAFRAESPEIEQIWGGQFVWCGPGKRDYRPQLFGLEGAFIAAVQNPGQWFAHYDVAYIYRPDVDVVFCRLPSGEDLQYHRPRLVPAVDKLNRGPCVQITFEGYNSNSAKGPVGWTVKETYGGRLFENVDQAVARDIQAEALLRAERSGYHVVMHTHDEVCAEVPIGFGSVEHMAAIMSERPAWASWWPIKAAGWRHKRYQKD